MMNTKKRAFTVHIIESNRTLKKSAEGDALKKILPFSKIKALHYVVNTESEFAAAVANITAHESSQGNKRQELPFLHFVMHASAFGVEIGGTKIPWSKLRDLLEPLRTQLEGNLLICMSACEGFFGYQLACCAEHYTYHFLVGTQKKLEWPDAVLAFHAFYHAFFFRKKSLPESVQAMNIRTLSKDYTFDYTWGSEVKRLHLLTGSIYHADVAIRGCGNKILNKKFCLLEQRDESQNG